MGETYYDEIASGYDELHGEEQLGKAKFILQNLDVTPSDVLLDVGCGTARALSVFGCVKIGIDPSFELLKRAQVPVVQGFAEKLPFSANSFDIVISITAIHHFSGIKQALLEMMRVSRRDIVIYVFKKAQKFKEIEEAIMSVLPVHKRIEETYDVVFFARKSFK
ncbi:Ubiquinone/menaquinone biosynthesis C-methyltransferase UbiE [uncultured archaeon]|nr:Ubiquinone/menaquinone biosynthesis C-methyltransferase UbiE [uncultured archaeon]